MMTFQSPSLPFIRSFSVNDMRKQRAIVIGATGAAGQNVVESLTNHPWFELVAVAASSRSADKIYSEAIEEARFFENTPSEEVLKMRVMDVEKVSPADFDLAFSALPSEVAKKMEPRFAEFIPVISTASAYRYEFDTPILIPDVNPKHAKLLKTQREKRGWRGFICPGPNCTTVGLAVSLKPLMDVYGIRSVHIVSEQALSGAGEKGLRLDSDYRRSVEMNVLPYIEGEEGKVEKETNKILGRLEQGCVRDAGIVIGATCTRVHVQSVHTEVVIVDTKKPCSVDDAKAAMRGYMSEPQRLGLPSAPEKPIIVFDEQEMPQPKLHRNYGGDVTLVGRLRKDPVFKNGLSYVVTSDNLDKGAGGGAVQTAEYLKAKRYF
jgi:aspartate-semialdehyde dehydrogenase